MDGGEMDNPECRACRKGSSSRCPPCLERRRRIEQQFTLSGQDANGGAPWREQKGADAGAVTRRIAQDAASRRRQ